MTPTVASIALPAYVYAVHAGDVNADGRDELVVELRTPAGNAPDKVTLFIVSVGADGRVGGSTSVELGNQPTLWDVNHGLWAIDKDGVRKFDVGTGTSARVASVPTPLAGLGPSTPSRWEFARDLDHDGTPELLVPSQGRLLAFEPDGGGRGGIPFASEGALGVEKVAGASVLTTSARLPGLAICDVDGDGVDDIVLPAHKSAAVYFTAPNLGARAATIALPIDLEPRELPPKPGEVKRTIADIWFQDLNGDNKADIAIDRWVTNGGFFGATAEILFAAGNGSGFGPVTTLTTSAAGFGVEPRDIDGDGDQDFVLREVDVGMGNLARALVSKAVRVQLSAFVFAGSAYGAKTTPLRGMTFPLEPPDRLQNELADVDGDGKLDVVTNDAEDRIRVYRGKTGGMEESASIDVPLKMPPGDDILFTHDFTGDGHAEILVWGPGQPTATLIRAQ